MPILPALDLTTLDPTAVANALALAQQVVQASFPTVTATQRGAVHDLVLYLDAVLSTATATNLATEQTASSLALVLANPALADPTTVDALLSNYGVTRGASSAASGLITIVLTQPINVSIGPGTTFTARGQTFAPTTVYSAKTASSNVIFPTDRLILSNPDGSYSFTIPVTCQTPGSAGMLTRSTLLAISPALIAFSSAYVAEDFTGGIDVQSNASLLASLPAAMACKAMSGPYNMLAALQANAATSGVLSASTIGYGDPESDRGYDTLFPINSVGKIDWYLRTAALPQQVAITKAATLIAIDAFGIGTWQLQLGRDDFPGFHTLQAVQPGDGTQILGTFPLVQLVYGKDTSSTGELIPAMPNPQDSRFTRFQTLTAQIIDTLLPATGLTINTSQRNYVCLVNGFPNIADAQNFVGGYGFWCRTADVLVKSVVPCQMTVTFSIQTAANPATINIPAIQQAVANLINNLGFSGRLAFSQILSAISSLLPADALVCKSDLLGQCLTPYDDVVYLRDPALLQIPQSPSKMLTPRTTQFVCFPSTVTVNLESLPTYN